MSLQNAVIEGAVVVLVLGYVIYRQTRWQGIDARQMWRAPIILAVIGIVEMRSAVGGGQLTATAVGLLVLSAVLSVGVGAAMGQLSQFRVADGQLQARTGVVGSVLWFVLLAVRIGVDVWGHMIGAAVVTSTGVILLMLALNRFGRSAMLLRRAERHHTGLPQQVWSS